MSRSMKSLVVSLSLLLTAGAHAVGYADDVVLTNGTTITGIIVQETEQAIVLDLGVGSLRLHRSEIANIRRASSEENASLRASWAASAPKLTEPPLRRAKPTKGLKAGQQPPQFSLKDLNGKRHQLKAYGGRAVLLHFWATWCPYCRGEIPKLKQIHEQWGGKEIVVLAVSTDESLRKLQQFVAQAQLPYPVISEVDMARPLSDLYRVSGLPTTYLIDAQGLVALRLVGQSDLLRAVSDVLARQRNRTSE